MILVGQFDSPFVRRVAIALHHYRIPFERQVLSVFKDFESMLAINPLGKVPSLILEDGDVLFDSRAIMEYLEETAPADRKLLPSQQPQRRWVQRTETIGIGLAEKIYERGIETGRRAPGKTDPAWRDRLETQISSACAWLDRLEPAPWMHPGGLSRADLAVAVAMQYLARVLPDHPSLTACQNLAAHRRRCEQLEIFQAVQDSTAEAQASGWQPPAGG